MTWREHVDAVASGLVRDVVAGALFVRNVEAIVIADGPDCLDLQRLRMVARWAYRFADELMAQRSKGG